MIQRSANCTPDSTLALWLVRTRWHNADALIHRHLPVGGVEVRIVTACLGDARPRVIRHHQLGRALIELKSPHMRADPTRQLLVRRGLSVGVRTRSHYRGE